MNSHLIKLASLLSLALTLAFFSPQQAAADDDDPPSRVARLSYERGAVSFEPGGTDEWVAARINRPMTTGDKLWTDAGSRAEMNTGSAYIRVGEYTGFSFLNLSDYATQIQLTEGTVLVRVRHLDRNETFEIDTPNLAFSIYQSGTYKVHVNEAGDVTVVQVRRGEGEVIGGGAAYSLYEGDEGRFAGTDGLVANIGSYRYRGDDFETWSSLRDRRIDHSYSSRYVSPDVIGYEDLDEYGGWRSSGEYGNVWFPHTTQVGWAPYHNGHWAYIAPWGYTWVDDEPWGFAPFHYGRWVNVEGSWGWVPGPREYEGGAYVRPVYAPALVAWVGGPHFAIGISVGGGGGYSQGESVGWFPLGPREVYVPSYPVSRTYVNNVNVSNTNVTNTVVNNYYNTTVVNNTNNSTNVNVTNVKYVNQTVPGAVTATTPQAFVSAQPVAKNVVQVNQREIASAPVRIAAPPVAPAREAVLGTTAQAAAKPPEQVVNRTVVAKTPPPPPPVPFVQQQKAIQANGGKPLPVSEIRQMRVQDQQQVQRQQQQQQQQQRSQPGQPAQAQQQSQQSPHPAVRIAPPAQPQNARPGQAEGNTGNRPVTPNNQQEQGNRPSNQNTQQQPQQQPQQSNRPGQPEVAPPNRPNTANPQQQQRTNPAQEQGNRPPQEQNRPPQQQQTKPEQPQNNNAYRPNTPNNQSNRPNNQPAENGNQRPAANDRPSSARPSNTPDPAVEQKHQQELEQLHKQQDQERQRVEQQQLQERKLHDQKAAEQQQQQERKLQEQKAAEQQRQLQQQQAQKNAEQQQQQKAAEQQRQQQLQQQQQQAQRNAEQQRQQLDQKHQQELRQLEEKHAQEQQQLNQRHEQEHQQQARPQPPPPPRQQQERQQPPPPPQKDKNKDKDKPNKDDRPPQGN